MTIMVTYPYDALGARDECHIQNESHVILTNDNTYRVIVPELAPFFNKDLVIRHTESGLELKEGKDYNLGYRVLSAKRIAERDLFGCIVLINPLLQGEFEVTYRTVGGNYVGVRSEVLSYLANALNDPVKTPFEKVLYRPSYFTPVKHEQHYADFTNKQYLADELDDLAQAIDDAISNADNTAVGDLMSRINAVDSLLNQFRQDLHLIDFNNPHGTTAEQAYALPKDAPAVDTFKAYNKTIVELAEYINSRGITDADVSQYLKKFGEQQYNGSLTLKDNQAVIRSESGTTSIDLSNGDVKISADKLLGIFANTDHSHMTERVSFMSGVNNLEVISAVDRSRNMESLLYNGHEVIHGENVRVKLKEKGGLGMRVVTQDTETVQWEGTSRPNSPLKGHVRIALATLVKRGSIQLSNNRTDNTLTTAPTPRVIKLMREDLEGRVPKARVINGHVMSSNFSLSKADINLTSVDNTADKDKPISTDQQTFLDGYSDIGHVHDISEMDLVRGTKDVLGVVKHAESVTDGIPSTVATPNAVMEYSTNVSELEDVAGGKMPADVLNVQFWRSSGEVTCVGYVITIPADSDLYMNRVNYRIDKDYDIPGGEFDIAAIYPNSYVGETFYLYANVSDGAVFYSIDKLKLPNNINRIHIATVKCDGVGISNVTATLGHSNHGYNDNVDGVLQIDRVTSVGPFRELSEHEDDPQAHLGGGVIGDANTIGLDLIKNYEVSDHVTDLSQQGVGNWEHSTYWNLEHSKELVITPHVNANYSVGFSQGIFVTVPWTSGGNQLYYMRNHSAKFNDPTYVSEVLTDGVYKRRVGYIFNTEKYGGNNIINWHTIIGSTVDSDGNVIDIVLVPSGGSSVSRNAELCVFVNGVQNAVLAKVGKGNWPIEKPYMRVFIELAFWETADGFKYVVDYQYDSIERTAEMDHCRVELTFRDNDFDMEVFWESYKDRYQTYHNTAKTTGIGYGNGTNKKAVDSGVIGFGGPVDNNDTTNNKVRLGMDCFAIDEGGQDKRYISAEGVYESLKRGANLWCVSGHLTDGKRVNIPPHCRYANIYLGWGIIGSTISQDHVNAAIDAVILQLRSLIDNSVIPDNRMDMFSIHKHVYVDAKWRMEYSGTSGAIDLPFTAHFLALGMRDT